MSAETGILVSVHDVMPETLDNVRTIVNKLESTDLCPVLLLVVPGRDWKTEDLDVLRNFIARGHQLAGHGWVHHVERFCTLKHYLHGRLLSKNVAEHLALDSNGIKLLLERCQHWFETNSLPQPQLYVPPAWAMGSIKPKDLNNYKFRYYEYLSGIYDSQLNRMHRVPLLGFEATTKMRAVALRMFNSLNNMAVMHTKLARLAIHPYDFNLYLKNNLNYYIQRGYTATTLDLIAK